MAGLSNEWQRQSIKRRIAMSFHRSNSMDKLDETIMEHKVSEFVISEEDGLHRIVARCSRLEDAQEIIKRYNAYEEQ